MDVIELSLAIPFMTTINEKLRTEHVKLGKQIDHITHYTYTHIYVHTYIRAYINIYIRAYIRIH